MPSIPTIDAKHIQLAVADIGRDGIPVGRGSTRFCLVAAGAHYPPKYVVALAARHAAGRELRPDEFSGGVQTNTILQNAGFTVRACTCGGTRVQSGGSGARVEAAPAAQSRRRQEQPLVPASRPMPSRTSASQASGEVTVVRLVARGRTPDNPAAEERMLLAALGPHWPERAQAKFTITPGGFVHGRWPIGTALSMTTSAPKAFYVTAAVSASLRRPTSFAPPTRSAASTDWHQIVLLYDRLLVVQPSPVVELNRAVAVAMHEGPEHGLRLVDDLLARDELASYHLAHAARAELCRRLGRLAEARASYEKALSLARHEPARRFLSGRLGALK